MNESVTFFLAGTLTQASVISNTITYMIQNKKVEENIRKCLTLNFSTFADKNSSLEKFADSITIDSLEYAKDDYLKYCLYESMRMETPGPFSSGFTVTENLDIGKY